MSLWLDMLGTEIRFVKTKSFGRIRIAEAGKPGAETILFQHGINGHLEAYAKNLIALAKDFHVVAFDYVGHGLSDKPELEYTPHLLAEQLGELMDALGLESAHLSGESLGGWVSALFAVKYPHRVKRLMLNTAGGLPVVSEKGKADLKNLIALNERNVNNIPTEQSVRARLEWLMHENNRRLVNDELIGLRLDIYLRPETRVVAPIINRIINRHDDSGGTDKEPDAFLVDCRQPHPRSGDGKGFVRSRRGQSALCHEGGLCPLAPVRGARGVQRRHDRVLQDRSRHLSLRSSQTRYGRP